MLVWPSREPACELPSSAECISYQARSSFDNLKAAATNLAEREGMPSTANVGFST
jgi:hypothetical protein